MRTIFCRVLKVPKDGDELRLFYTGSRGGMTEAAYKVRDKAPVGGNSEPMTVEEVAQGLANAIGGSWTGELFSCRVRGDEIVITCGHDDITFHPMHNGTEAAGREYLQVEH